MNPPTSRKRSGIVARSIVLASAVCLAGCAAGPNAGGDSRTPYKGNAVWNIAGCVDAAPADAGARCPSTGPVRRL